MWVLSTLFWMLLRDVPQSCHSGTALDLPYVYSTEGKIKEPNIKLEAGKDALEMTQAYLTHNVRGMLEGAGGLFQIVSGQKSRPLEVTRQTRTSAADVVGPFVNPWATRCPLRSVDFMERLQGRPNKCRRL